MMGSRWELAQRRAKHNWYCRHEEIFWTQLSNLPNICFFPGVISVRKGSTGSLAAQCPVKSALWAPSLPGTRREPEQFLHCDKVPLEPPLETCPWFSSLGKDHDSSWLCQGWAEALLVARPLTEVVPKVQGLKYLKFWPVFVLYIITVQIGSSLRLRRAPQWLPQIWESAKFTTEMHTNLLVSTPSVCKSLPNQGWDDNANFTVIRNDTEDVLVMPHPCTAFPFSSFTGYSSSRCTL